jgi:hypothetical protein
LRRAFGLELVALDVLALVVGELELELLVLGRLELVSLDVFAFVVGQLQPLAIVLHGSSSPQTMAVTY